MELLSNLVSAAGGAAIVLAALAYVPRRWVDGLFDRQMEKVKAELLRTNFEHQIRFTRLDEKLTLALEGAYEILCEYATLSSQLVNQVYVENEEVYKPAYEQWESLANDFSSFMLKQSIYLPEDIALRMGSTRLALRDALVKRLDTWREFKDNEGVGRVSSPFLKGLYESSGMRSECAELMNDLQKLARSHLARFPGDPNAT